MTACPKCESKKNFVVYPKSDTMSIFTCLTCGEDTPFEVKP